MGETAHNTLPRNPPSPLHSSVQTHCMCPTYWPKMRIHFGSILSRYLNRKFYSDEISTLLLPTTGLTEFTRFQDFGTDEILPPITQILPWIKITLKYALWSSTFEGVPWRNRENIQLTNHLPLLFYLPHSFEGCVPWFSPDFQSSGPLIFFITHNINSFSRY